MSSLNVTNLKHPSSSTNNIVLNSDGSVTGVSKTVTDTKTLTGGQYVTFTGIPDNVTTIAINYYGCDPGATTEQFIRVGTSSGLLTSGYNMLRGYVGSSNSASRSTSNNSFCPNDYYNSGNIYYGKAVLTNVVNDDWHIQWFFWEGGSTTMGMLNGYISVGATLDRVAYGFNGGSADSGTVRIEYST